MKKLKKIISWESMPVTVLLIAIIIINYNLSPNAFKSVAMNHFFLNNTAAICLAIGITAAMLSGGIDLSGGAIVALVDVTIVILFDKGYPVWQVIPIALILGTACGLLNGVAIGVFRIIPLLATFATSFIFNGLAKVIMPAAVSKNFNTAFASFYTQRVLHFIPLTVIFILLIVAFWIFMMKRRMGLELYATGQNELKAYLSGVNVVRCRIFAYTLGGFAAALGAIAMTASYGGGEEEVGANLSMIAITAAVLGGVSMAGGKGNVWGGIMGSVFLAFVTNLIVFMRVPTTAQPFVKGLVYLVALIFATLVSRINFAKALERKTKKEKDIEGGAENE